MIQKFRAWDKRKNKWVDYPIYIDSEGNIYWQNYERGLQEADDLIIMQYTGLKDKNGVEIYEGDLVEHDDDIGDGWETYEPAEIVFDIDYAQFCFKWDVSNFLINYKNLKVIGNVYENPDLVK